MCTRVRGGGLLCCQVCLCLRACVLLLMLRWSFVALPIPTTHLTSLRVALSFFPLGAIFLTSVGWDGRSG